MPTLRGTLLLAVCKRLGAAIRPTSLVGLLGVATLCGILLGGWLALVLFGRDAAPIDHRAWTMDKTAANDDDTSRQLARVQDRMTRLEATLSGIVQAPPANIPRSSESAVKFRNYWDRKRILVSGGAGFVGSHLVDRLMRDGHEVVAVDNFFTGNRRNLEQWIGHRNFQLVTHDIVNSLYLEVDQIYHLASPASPPHYMYNPVKTIKVNTIGTINMLGLAKRVRARILLASTSEVYGDPDVHPQPETYWGNVNPIGPRSCYDEGKRVAEALAYSYAKQEGVPIRIARIFNTYGPRMHINDGRVVSNFLLQAIRDQPITIYGNGSQTRSFQYVDDLIDGLVLLMNSDYSMPVNIGNTEEHSIADFARIIIEVVGSKSKIVFSDAPEDDPRRRQPDISVAKRVLGWEPKVQLYDGLRRTSKYIIDQLDKSEASTLPHA